MLIYLIVILGIIAAVVGGYGYVHHQGYASAEADYKPKLQRALDDKDQELAANDRLRENFKQLDSAVKDCNAKVEAASRQTERAKLAAAEAVAKANARSKGLETTIADLQRRAKEPSTKPKGEQCEAAAAVLGDLSDRMRHPNDPPQ